MILEYENFIKEFWLCKLYNKRNKIRGLAFRAAFLFDEICSCRFHMYVLESSEF